MNKELIERFEKETNNKFYTTNIDKGEDLYSYDFVDWLIKQLLIDVVVGQSKQLMRDTFIKSREETARAREASAIKQTLEIYCAHDELPTVNEVLERIGRKH